MCVWRGWGGGQLRVRGVRHTARPVWKNERSCSSLQLTCAVGTETGQQLITDVLLHTHGACVDLENVCSALSTVMTTNNYNTYNTCRCSQQSLPTTAQCPRTQKVIAGTQPCKGQCTTVINIPTLVDVQVSSTLKNLL